MTKISTESCGTMRQLNFAHSGICWGDVVILSHVPMAFCIDLHSDCWWLTAVTDISDTKSSRNVNHEISTNIKRSRSGEKCMRPSTSSSGGKNSITVRRRISKKQSFAVFIIDRFLHEFFYPCPAAETTYDLETTYVSKTANKKKKSRMFTFGTIVERSRSPLIATRNRLRMSGLIKRRPRLFDRSLLRDQWMGNFENLNKFHEYWLKTLNVETDWATLLVK